MIEDRIVTEILDEVTTNDLGIQEGHQILKIDGKSIPTSKLNDYLESKDDFEFEIQVILVMLKFVDLVPVSLRLNLWKIELLDFIERNCTTKIPPISKLFENNFL